MEQKKRRVILVGVNVDKNEDFEYSMLELKNLAIACDFEVVDKLVQNAEKIHNGHYLGKGKLEELSNIMKEKDIEIAVFYDELSPAQIKNIEKYLESTIMDRTNLILDIFASRAQTKEAKMQVEIAQLQYMLPHLTGSYTNLSRQGGTSGTAANKGAGETKLELDKRKMLSKISKLKKELEKITGEREVQRNLRESRNVPVVSLVGYTNSGKSTIMNVLVDVYGGNEEKKVLEKNMLFATLETSVRQINLERSRNFLLTDTVGFVDKLPHKLVKAFRSTLEEIKMADVILHVVDYSNVDYEKQIEVTNQTLEEIGVGGIPVIYVYNKCDLKGLRQPRLNPDSVFISAKEKMGIRELITIIKQEIFKDYVSCKMLIPFDKGNISAYLIANSQIISNKYINEGTLLELECSKSDYEKYKEYLV